MWGLSATAYLQRILHPNNNNTQQNAPFLAVSTWVAFKLQKTMWKNYFTSSDPHHDMLGEGCQVRVAATQFFFAIS